MIKNLDFKIQRIVLAKAKLFLAMDKGKRIAAVYSFCKRRVMSHVQAAAKSGWYLVSKTDKYGPYKNKEYVVFTVVSKNITVQIAFNDDDDKIYVTGYLPERGGWYGWEEYFIENHQLKVNQSKIEMKQNSSDILAENDQVKQLYTGASFQGEKNKEFCSVGIPIFQGTRNKNEISVSVNGIESLEDIKNKLIAIKIQSEIVSGNNEFNKLNVVNVGTANLEYKQNIEGIYSEEIYFVYFDGCTFHCCGRLI